MESRIEKAVENHKEGYNCAQAVACAYCGLTGADEAMVFQMMEGYGGNGVYLRSCLGGSGAGRTEEQLRFCQESDKGSDL